MPFLNNVRGLKDVDFTLNKREFKDAVHSRYDWQISHTPSTCACGDVFDVDHALVHEQTWRLHYLKR